MNRDMDRAGQDDDLDYIWAQDLDLRDTADQVRAVLREPGLDAAFSQRLRADLVAERTRVLAERRQRRWRLPRLQWPAFRWRLLRSPAPALGIAAAALAVVALLTVTLIEPLVGGGRPVAVTLTAAVAGQVSVDPGAHIMVGFSPPMNHAAVEAALRISPATQVTTAWKGNQLVVTPVHGLAQNVPYVVTIDRAKARTATGAPVDSDLHLLFGTGLGAPANGPPLAQPLPLKVSFAATAAPGSEAVIASDGSLIATNAAASSGGGQQLSGLLRFRNGQVAQLAAATDAICVSRSGRSLAYLVGSGSTARIVMAAGDGSAGWPVAAAVDAGSPLGWIGDDEVSFVGGGQLRAVDRAGKVRLVGSQRIDAARDTVVVAPGGRYLFWRPAPAPGAAAAPGQGQLIDLASHAAHPLPGVVGDPSFAADGGTVAWIDGSGPAPSLSSAPSAGGPVRLVPLPGATASEISDLGLSPDGVHVAYSVTHQGGFAELRIAQLADGATVSLSQAGAGASPNWSPSGDRLAVLGDSGGPVLRVAALPAQLLASQVGFGGAVADFANAQIGGDTGALQALAAPDVSVSGLPRPSRVSVVQVVAGTAGTATAHLMLTFDAQPGHPVARTADEQVHLLRDPASGRSLVSAVQADAVHDLLPGPHVLHLGQDPSAHMVAVLYDCDMDPSSVAGSNVVRTAQGAAVPFTSGYDAASRTVLLTLPASVTGTVQLSVTSGLRDVNGQHLAATIHTTLALS